MVKSGSSPDTIRRASGCAGIRAARPPRITRPQCSGEVSTTTSETPSVMSPATSSSTAATNSASLLGKYGYDAVVDSPASRQMSATEEPR